MDSLDLKALFSELIGGEEADHSAFGILAEEKSLDEMLSETKDQRTDILQQKAHPSALMI